MKKFYVNVHCDYIFPAVVEADNEEQAHELAVQMFEKCGQERIELNDITDICTTDIEDID